MIDARFIVMTDTHFTPPGKGKDGRWWNRTLGSQSLEIGEALISTVNDISPDFIIHCGDFTHLGDVQSFQFGVDIMNRMSCPYYIILGNHDAEQKGIRNLIRPLIENDNGNFYYSRQLAGIRFIFIDSAFWVSKDGKEYNYKNPHFVDGDDYLGLGPSQEVLDWLKHELLRNKTQPTIIVTHVPIYSKQTYPVETLQMGNPKQTFPTPYHHFASYSIHDKTINEVISKQNNVVAVFSGHWHISDITTVNGVIHCQTGSLMEYPFELRVVDKGHNQLNLSTIGLNDKKFQYDSFIPEWNNRWVAGQPDDREISVELNY